LRRNWFPDSPVRANGVVINTPVVATKRLVAPAAIELAFAGQKDQERFKAGRLSDIKVP